MTTNSINGASQAAFVAADRKTGLGALGQADFLKLMTVQMQQQDPFDPVDQKEMLAQMAQFSSLAGTAQMGETLKDIAAKLDAVIAAQGIALPSPSETTPDIQQES
ncbi:hypothetical protein GCM10011371_30390 [Novosphingobium marinum]|uniref:Basal-body rod modification protein FlgD n=1 Tax=Novosphingobium marinum TaxID=1514948 RepID=A0A7Y9XXN3_9SPHN|nr:flagellar hook capping FlgD N-terminal domain-containing protein [Novosphingobium marinum]NYH95008.1 flagellar basal-body rod modification protein FlgD [Novosphingobium marinum]GGC40886.1 hypothetical protein GCM10011371_30390 [Novosphingobium marinum]